MSSKKLRVLISFLFLFFTTKMIRADFELEDEPSNAELGLEDAEVKWFFYGLLELKLLKAPGLSQEEVRAYTKEHKDSLNKHRDSRNSIAKKIENFCMQKKIVEARPFIHQLPLTNEHPISNLDYAYVQFLVFRSKEETTKPLAILTLYFYIDTQVKPTAQKVTKLTGYEYQLLTPTAQKKRELE